MAFMESQAEAQARIKSNPNGKIEIAVCLRDKRSLECIDQTGLDMSWEIVTAERRYEPLAAQPAPETIDFHAVLLVPIKHLAGTVLVKIDEQATGKDAMRARTLVSVGEFGAKHGRVAPGTRRAKELGDPFSPEQEALELGLMAPSTSGTLGNAAATVPAGDGATADDGDNEASFWMSALKVIGEAFGAIFTQPVTDITTEPVVPCSCSPGIKFQVPQSSSSSGTGSSSSSSQQQTSSNTQANGWTSSSSGSKTSDSSGGWFGGAFKKPESSSSTSSNTTSPAPSSPSPAPSSDPAPQEPATPSSPAPSSQPPADPAAPSPAPADPAAPPTPPAEPAAPPPPPAEPATPPPPPAEPAAPPPPPAEPAAPPTSP
jgi:hypothetical protein